MDTSSAVKSDELKSFEFVRFVAERTAYCVFGSIPAFAKLKL